MLECVVVFYVLRYFRIVAYTVLFCTPLLVWSALDRSGDPTVRVARRWARSLLRTTGVKVRVEGLAFCSTDRPGVLMSNHRSVFDILALIETLPTPFRFVAKKELTYIPIFGWALALSGQIIVDRGDRSRAIGALQRAAAKIRGGTKVLVFPEGTRGEDQEMLPFKSGGFHLAPANEWPILPVAIIGSEKITPKGSLRVEPGEILLVFGEPIATAGRSELTVSALKSEVREEVAALIARRETNWPHLAAGEWVRSRSSSPVARDG